MKEKEELCNAYLEQADNVFQYNNNRHTKKECEYLQKAAALRTEMAKISEGAEREAQLSQLHDINLRIRYIIKEIDPEKYKKIEEEIAKRKLEQKKAAEEQKAAAAAKKQSGQKPTGSASSKGSASSMAETAVLSQEMQNWFKEAPRQSFDDVAGMSDLKERLKECISDSKLNDIRKHLNMTKLHSYFFIGPPGCGKTYIIEAFAHELMDKDYKYISLVGSDILSKFVGEAEKTIAKLFEEATNNAPCIVFVDEVDGVCKNRSLDNLPDYAKSITTSFLLGYNKLITTEKPIIFIGATNYPSQVDDAMIDRVEIIKVPYPDLEAREGCFKRYFDDILQLEEGFAYKDMGVATEKYNYRDIQRLVNRIKELLLKDTMEKYSTEQEAIEAMKSGEYRMSIELFDRAYKEVVPTPKNAIDEELREWESKFSKNRFA